MQQNPYWPDEQIIRSKNFDNCFQASNLNKEFIALEVL
jgi:hypothetical protein